MPKVSIIIVTRNARGIINECLDSVFSQDYRDYETMVIDNNSSDGTNEFIKKNYPQVTLLNNDQNVGFCRANNQGIEIAQGEFILTLNSDVVLENSFLTELINASKNLAPAIGMLGPKILGTDKKTIDSTGIILTKVRRFYNRGSGEIDLGQYDDKRDIFGSCAAAAFYKREMLETIKVDGEYFDKDFFFLAEDVDLAWRANLAGWRGYFVPEARCYHHGNSSGMSKKMRQYLSFRNRYFMMMKNERLDEFIRELDHFLFYDITRFFYLIFTNPIISRTILGTVYFLGSMFKKRRFYKTYWPKTHD